MDLSQIDFSANFVVSPGDPDFEEWAEQEEIENWIADGCPDIEGIHIPEQEREILLARPLTVAQAARREAVSERTIYRWLRAGELEASRAGRGWRIDPAALNARRIRSAQPKPAASIRRRRARKRPQAASDGSWWPS